MSSLINYNEYLHITIIVAGILHVAGTPPGPTAAQSADACSAPIAGGENHALALPPTVFWHGL